MDFSNDLKKRIKEVVQKDGVIAFVTDTVWGLGCLPSSEKAVRRIYEIKKREAKKPLILMSNNVENLLPYVKKVPPVAEKLIKEHFPGALTLVLEKSDKTPSYITSDFDTVGIRVPDNEIFQKICEIIDTHVLATTSANLSSEPSAKTYEQAVENMGEKVDLVIEDFGFQAKGLESTVALISNGEVKVLRQGAIIL